MVIVYFHTCRWCSINISPISTLTFFDSNNITKSLFIFYKKKCILTEEDSGIPWIIILRDDLSHSDISWRSMGLMSAIGVV